MPFTREQLRNEVLRLQRARAAGQIAFHDYAKRVGAKPFRILYKDLEGIMGDCMAVYKSRTIITWENLQYFPGKITCFFRYPEERPQEETETEGKLYNVFNGTDGVYSNHEPLTYQEAQQFVEDFPKKYAAQGYYKDSMGQRIDPSEVLLEIEEVDDSRDDDQFENEVWSPAGNEE